MKLDNSVAAVVTGGASGLGEATARMLANSGARVAILDRRPEAGEEVAADIRGLYCEADVTDEQSVATALDRARSRHGTERVLVNCAGIAPAKRMISGSPASGLLVSHDVGTFRDAIEVNLVGTFQMMVLCANAMAVLPPATPDGVRGVIVNTASIAAYEGQVGQTAYAASKAGVIGLTLPAARDLASYGIRVMTIMPGLFQTDMVKRLPDEVRSSLHENTTFPRRFGRPQEFARLVRSIVQNDMLNGEAIRLDGALRMTPR